jgi:hypothetical protein
MRLMIYAINNENVFINITHNVMRTDKSYKYLQVCTHKYFYVK